MGRTRIPKKATSWAQRYQGREPGKPQGLQLGGVGGRKQKLTHTANEQLVLGTSNALHGDNSDGNRVASRD